MRITSLLCASLCLLSSAPREARAQDIREEDKPRVLAALSIASFDALAEKCAGDGGFNDAQREEVERWRKSQSVDKLRAHLAGPGLTAALKEQVKAGAAEVLRVTPRSMSFCTAATVMTRTGGAQFADKLPALLVNAPVTAAPPAPGTASRPAPGGIDSGTPHSATAAQMVGEIEGFAFDSCTRVGYGGMVMYAPCPVVLFKRGFALTDVEGLNYPKGVMSHQFDHPQDWTHWRREGGRIELIRDGNWKGITYTTVYSALPKGFTLDGRYHSSSGGGNTALGGGQAVVAWSDYLFGRDGSVQRDGGAASSTTGGGADITTSGSKAAKRGRYRIEGLILAIDYDDGSRERRVIIADPKDQGRGTMWLDGEGYVYKK